ncbi:MAG TPA: hypothetical protein VGD55_01730, partial [Acidothermaceae bacterium]
RDGLPGCAVRAAAHRRLRGAWSSFPTGPDADIWWNDTGCQNADNGHVEVYFYGVGLPGGDFPGGVENVFPAAP